MTLKKTYYSISEVSKMLNIKEHTIRFWDSKLPHLSKRDQKGKSRFFNQKQIEKISKINEILKNNDSIKLAFQIISGKSSNNSVSFNKEDYEKKTDSLKNIKKIDKFRAVSNKLKNLII